jgi:hypothetical protein
VCKIFELRVTEALESDEIYKVRSEVGIAFQFDELVGGHVVGAIVRLLSNEIEKQKQHEDAQQKCAQSSGVAID